MLEWHKSDDIFANLDLNEQIIFPVPPNAADQKIQMPRHILFGGSIPDLPNPDQNMTFEIDALRLAATQTMRLAGWASA